MNGATIVIIIEYIMFIDLCYSENIQLFPYTKKMLHKGPKRIKGMPMSAQRLVRLPRKGNPHFEYISVFLRALARRRLAVTFRGTFLDSTASFYMKGDNAVAQVSLMSFPRKDTGDLYIVVKKVLAFNQDEGRHRFNSQAPKIFKLQHEHIARTYAIVQSGDFIRILMEPMDYCLERLRARVSLFFIGCN